MNKPVNFEDYNFVVIPTHLRGKKLAQFLEQISKKKKPHN